MSCERILTLIAATTVSLALGPVDEVTAERFLHQVEVESRITNSVVPIATPHDLLFGVVYTAEIPTVNSSDYFLHSVAINIQFDAFALTSSLGSDIYQFAAIEFSGFSAQNGEQTPCDGVSDGCFASGDGFKSTGGSLVTTFSKDSTANFSNPSFLTSSTGGNNAPYLVGGDFVFSASSSAGPDGTLGPGSTAAFLKLPVYTVTYELEELAGGTLPHSPAASGSSSGLVVGDLAIADDDQFPDFARLPGDYNFDLSVNVLDRSTWGSSYGSSSGPADGNGDGVVDAADYTIWRDNLGAGLNETSTATSIAVPEPSAALLLAFAFTSVRRR